VTVRLLWCRRYILPSSTDPLRNGFGLPRPAGSNVHRPLPSSVRWNPGQTYFGLRGGAPLHDVRGCRGRARPRDAHSGQGRVCFRWPRDAHSPLTMLRFHPNKMVHFQKWGIFRSASISLLIKEVTSTNELSETGSGLGSSLEIGSAELRMACLCLC